LECKTAAAKVEMVVAMANWISLIFRGTNYRPPQAPSALHGFISLAPIEPSRPLLALRDFPGVTGIQSFSGLYWHSKTLSGLYWNLEPSRTLLSPTR